ncbi:hypothetical protein Ga0100230_016515 [Opitutaceae bacterium TAV3]|nr:hypothetical protein Ga0100230_016515 [Opitutaceae bacterium TAV3]
MSTDLSSTSGATVTLYAKWTINQYTVTFDVSTNGGTGGQSASVTATYGSAMPTISTTAPTKTGHTFTGWYDASSGGTQYYTATGVSARNYDKTSGTTLYAQFTANTYTVTFNADGGLPAPGSQTVNHGETATEPTPAPTKTGYTFAGWYDGANVYTFSTPVTGALTLTAHWTLAGPTIPAVIDEDTVVVISDPTTPGGIVIVGEISADPTNPDQSQVFEQEKITLVTATDILSTWGVADPSTYTVEVAPDGKSFTVIVAPSADAARFYRVATTLQPVDNASGAPVAGDTVAYNTTITGQYKVILPTASNGGKRLAALQVQPEATASTIEALLADLPWGGSVSVYSGSSVWLAGKNSRGAWIGDYQTVVPLGAAIEISNSSTGSAVPFTFVGRITEGTWSRTLADGIGFVASPFPARLGPDDLGIPKTQGDFALISTDLGLTTHLVINDRGTLKWAIAAGVPVPEIGTAFFLQKASGGDIQWTQRLTISPSSLTISATVE